jgi:thioredoxin 1
VNVDELEDVVLEADVRVVRNFDASWVLRDRTILILQVPTYMVFKDGKKVGHATGVDGTSLNVSTSCLSYKAPYLTAPASRN